MAILEFSNKPHIYIITNLVNNKQYVGQTSGGNKYYICGGLIIKRAIKKYNIENFSRKIIEEGDFNQEQLNDLEIKYIHQYNTLVPNGYNISQNGRGTHLIGHTPWNKGGGVYSSETIKKMSESHLGKNHSEELKIHWSNIKKGISKPEGFKDIISKRFSKAVIEYHLDGSFSRNWNSATEAAKFYNCSIKAISKCCLGESKSSNNKIFKYR